MRREHAIVRVGVAVFVLALAGGAGGVGQSGGCFEGSPIPDPLNARCLKLPTSLPCVTKVPDPDGYEALSTKCGTKRCYWVFRCECGRPLGFPCDF